MEWVRAHRKTTIAIGLSLFSLIGMTISGTLSYPWIMIDRQIQSLVVCTYGTSTFTTEEFGFTFIAPSDFCFLPHRIFPEDTSVQVLPKDFYFSFNEYAKGTVTSAAHATLLFEPAIDGRRPADLVLALEKGGFLEGATLTNETNPAGLYFYKITNAKGIDDTKRFNWAFTMHPDGKSVLTILSAKVDDPTIFNTLIDSVGTTTK